MCRAFSSLGSAMIAASGVTLPARSGLGAVSTDRMKHRPCSGGAGYCAPMRAQPRPEPARRYRISQTGDRRDRIAGVAEILGSVFEVQAPILEMRQQVRGMVTKTGIKRRMQGLGQITRNLDCPRPVNPQKSVGFLTGHTGIVKKLMDLIANNELKSAVVG